MALKRRILRIDSEIGKHIDAKKQNAVRITGAACAASFLLGSGKLLMGIFSSSFFTIMNAFYTYGMVTAKLLALRGLMVSPQKQTSYYKGAADILITASLCYAVYSTRLLWNPENTQYHPYLAMGIATVMFTEIGMNLWGVLAERKAKSPMFHAIKTINLASSLIGLVLTQAAILSFTHPEEGYDPSLANSILGLCMGGCAAFLGCFMLWRTARLKTPQLPADADS